MVAETIEVDFKFEIGSFVEMRGRNPARKKYHMDCIAIVLSQTLTRDEQESKFEKQYTIRPVQGDGNWTSPFPVKELELQSATPIGDDE